MDSEVALLVAIHHPPHTLLQLPFHLEGKAMVDKVTLLMASLSEFLLGGIAGLGVVAGATP
jgi:hypothetical protein